MADVNPVQVQEFLSNVDYPVSKDELIEHAQSEGADESIMSALERLPDTEFDSPAEVSEAIGANQ